MVNCTSYLFILDINFLVISFANISSHLLGCPSVLLMASFAMQKPLHLARSHFFIFAVIYFALGDRDPKILIMFISKSAVPIFSSRSFLFSGLIFRSLLHFEFIFVYGVRNCSNLILLHVVIQWVLPFSCSSVSVLYLAIKITFKPKKKI